MTLKTDYKTGHPHYPTKWLKVRLAKLELAKRSRLLGRRTAQSAPRSSIDNGEKYATIKPSMAYFKTYAAMWHRKASNLRRPIPHQSERERGITFVCCHQTMVCCRQTIVCSHQTMVCYQQTMSAAIRYKKRPICIGLKIGIKQQIYKLLSLLIKHLYRQRTAGQLYFSPEGLKVAHKICT